MSFHCVCLPDCKQGKTMTDQTSHRKRKATDFQILENLLESHEIY